MKELSNQRFISAAALLPDGMRRDALKIGRAAEEAEEIHLRAGRYPTVLLSGREQFFSQIRADAGDMRYVLERATQSSLHTAAEAIKQGYVTTSCGLRVGISGTAAVEKGSVIGLRHISGLCIRISRQIPGIAAPVIKRLGGVDRMPSTLIISPPGAGKTTLLRDMVRIISDSGVRVSLCDERGEIAALTEGVPQFDVGLCTDVMDGCPRGPALEMLLRSMNPQVLAADEIASERDAEALLSAAGCGVKLLATAHANDRHELYHHPLFYDTGAIKLFGAVITVKSSNGRREYETGRLEAEVYQTFGRGNGNIGICPVGGAAGERSS